MMPTCPVLTVQFHRPRGDVIPDEANPMCDLRFWKRDPVPMAQALFTVLELACVGLALQSVCCCEPVLLLFFFLFTNVVCRPGQPSGVNASDRGNSGRGGALPRCTTALALSSAWFCREGRAPGARPHAGCSSLRSCDSRWGWQQNSVLTSSPCTTFQRRLLSGACRNLGQKVGHPPAGRQTRGVCVFPPCVGAPGWCTAVAESADPDPSCCSPHHLGMIMIRQVLGGERL
ncbi:hypothetical protein NDU88_001216 [Pleurodeles waltl]|uniref:Uncharacterized protein n=1 Tax=Pleurodeles waltl TaxID=8319 RepID=A0AAV7R6F1_PLEWA|nr:hypothetical protein NDU88_001216 [Pleurodeles waltl]